MRAFQWLAISVLAVPGIAGALGDVHFGADLRIHTPSPFTASVSCTGAPICAGSYTATLRRAGCSNSFVLADSVTITGLTPSGALNDGSISLANLDFTTVARPDGTCSFGTVRALNGSHSGLTASLTDMNGNVIAASFIFNVVSPVDNPLVDVRDFRVRVDGATANAGARLVPLPGDVGTQSNIYAFAYAPRALVAGAIAAPKDGATDCVLAQLDSTNRLVGVSASNLRPYVSGVLSSQGQSVAVLEGVPVWQVAGATFFVGYGADPNTMIARNADESVVSIPGSAQCPSAFPATPAVLSGLWWNPDESGWGINLTQRGDNIFAAWYTYDASGRPKWYVASNCTGVAANASSGTCSGTVYEVNGPRFFGVDFVPIVPGQVSSAGNLRIAFTDADNAIMTFTVAGVGRTVAIRREIFPINPTAPPPVDYTDMWWNPSESGWGMAITHQYNNILLLWYVYDDTGRPMWYVASNCLVVGNQCSGTLYRTTGPAFGTVFDTRQISVFAVGSATLTFETPNQALLSYTVDGVKGSKMIVREVF